MSSILTNNSAMNALSTLRDINKSLSSTQDRISSGLKVTSSKDNAAYFTISQTMSGDSSIYKAIDENLTLTMNSVATARLGAENVAEITKQFVERVAFAQGGTDEVKAGVQLELNEMVARIKTTMDQSSFNGSNLVSGNGPQTVVTGISRDAAGVISTTNMTFNEQDLGVIHTALAGIDVTAAADAAAMEALLQASETQLGNAISAATNFGIAEKSIGTQQEFLAALTDRLDSGVGSMIDADMEEEAARLQSLQVQQQLASQALSIANQAPQNILSLFR